MITRFSHWNIFRISISGNLSKSNWLIKMNITAIFSEKFTLTWSVVNRRTKMVYSLVGSTKVVILQEFSRISNDVENASSIVPEWGRSLRKTYKTSVMTCVFSWSLWSYFRMDVNVLRFSVYIHATERNFCQRLPCSRKSQTTFEEDLCANFMSLIVMCLILGKDMFGSYFSENNMELHSELPHECCCALCSLLSWILSRNDTQNFC